MYSDINVSRGSVATRIRRSWIGNNPFTANLMANTPVKGF